MVTVTNIDNYMTYHWKLNEQRKLFMGKFELHEYNDRIELWGFRIFDRFQGKGHAEKMLAEVIALAKGKKLILYVLKCNTKAIHVYEKSGFKITGEYPGTWDEAWEMTYVKGR